jgi:hypothetical protein
MMVRKPRMKLEVVYNHEIYFLAGASSTPVSTTARQSLPADLLNPLPDDSSVSSDELDNLSEQTLQKKGLKV